MRIKFSGGALCAVVSWGLELQDRTNQFLCWEGMVESTLNHKP